MRWNGCLLRAEATMPTKIDLNGMRFTRLLVVGDGAKMDSGRRRVKCLCDCGNVLDVEPRSLRNGHSQSCGCLHREKVRDSSASRIKHGNARAGMHSPTYLTWQAMKKRCNNPSEPKFPSYGGRGIKVCDEWDKSFDAFLACMGPRPSRKYTIDRIDVNGNYEPGNCRWATPVEQARNKRSHRYVTHEGRQVPLSQACQESGVNYQSALYRLKVGKPWMPLPTPPVHQEEEK